MSDMDLRITILYTDYFGKLTSKWTITKMIYDNLSKKDKLRWIKIEK